MPEHFSDEQENYILAQNTEGDNGTHPGEAVSGFVTTGIVTTSRIVQSQQSLLNDPAADVGDTLYPPLMGRPISAIAEDWSMREVQLRRQWIEENITFRHRQKWELLPEWHRDFYAKTAYDIRQIPAALMAIEKKEAHGSLHWYGGRTAQQEVSLRMSLERVGRLIFVLPCQQDIYQGFLFAVASLIRLFGMPAYGKGMEKLPAMTDAELMSRIKRLSKDIVITLADVKACGGLNEFHGLRDCIAIWERYYQEKMASDPTGKKQTNKNQRSMEPRDSTEEKYQEYREYYEELRTNRTRFQTDNDLIKKTAENFGKGTTTIRRAIKSKK